MTLLYLGSSRLAKYYKRVTEQERLGTAVIEGRKKLFPNENTSNKYQQHICRLISQISLVTLPLVPLMGTSLTAVII